MERGVVNPIGDGEDRSPVPSAQKGWRDIFPPPRGRVSIPFARSAVAIRSRWSVECASAQKEMLEITARSFSWQ